MLVLVIDTSSAAVTTGIVALSADGAPSVRAQRVSVDGRAHAELLAPSVRDCLAEAGVGLTELAAIVAGVGPGPFTGLRVGLVTAAALADATGLPSYPVCSLDAIAAVHPEAEDLLVAGDARRKEVYWARYRYAVRVAGPAVCKPDQLSGGSADLSGCTAMVGAGAALYQSVLNLPILQGEYPTVLGLATVAAPKVLAGAPSEPLVPLYLRRPDAVAATARKAVSQ
ncbi:MAG: tRNA (adenosine(37)-N6)-threonylcarbamoyltransferase complex dimerization subunit type 1 TsaB [Jatrophihabitantaceae bacterium]